MILVGFHPRSPGAPRVPDPVGVTPSVVSPVLGPGREATRERPQTHPYTPKHTCAQKITTNFEGRGTGTPGRGWTGTHRVGSSPTALHSQGGFLPDRPALVGWVPLPALGPSGLHLKKK